MTGDHDDRRGSDQAWRCPARWHRFDLFRHVLRRVPGLSPLPIRITRSDWQARRESNPQPAVLETAALPIELLACA